MSDFRVSLLQNSSVLFIYTERDSLQLDPDYQRMSDVWTEEKRQLLIDSIINGYDIPKIYFHEFLPSKKIGRKMFKYSIIDGKQRLETIWKFINGEFNLSNDFEYLHDKTVKAAGLSYSELAREYPKLKTKFDSTTLAIIAIQTDDIELIEDMFSRLNEAVPLNAAEKRNAFGGPLPPAIRAVSKHDLFIKKIPFSNKRYRHYDLATKFLYLEYTKGVKETKGVDTKKVYLDEFVKSYKNKKKSTVENLINETKEVLISMSSVFTNSDKLLSSVGMIVVFYLVFRNALKDGWLGKITRNNFVAFDESRSENRKIAENDISKANYDLLEFDRLSWSPNDGVSIEYRCKILKDYILKNQIITA